MLFEYILFHLLILIHLLLQASCYKFQWLNYMQQYRFFMLSLNSMKNYQGIQCLLTVLHLIGLLFVFFCINTVTPTRLFLSNSLSPSLSLRFPPSLSSKSNCWLFILDRVFIQRFPIQDTHEKISGPSNVVERKLVSAMK